MRKIHPAHGHVFFDVANNIGELKRQSAAFRQWLGRGIAISKNLDAYQPYDRGDAITILPQLFKRLVARNQRSSAGGIRPTVLKIRRRAVGKLVEKPHRNLIGPLGIGQRQQHRIVGWLRRQGAVHLVQPFQQFMVPIGGA